MLNQQQINIISTLKPFNPTKVGIFGSFARGENTNESDEDILYTFENVWVKEAAIAFAKKNVSM